ncbi:MAG TPA: cytochrome c3 family protein [Anaerolineales bacterium]|nr:cytochrome c3 family protein [Anaerolineales bacterium]
MNQPPQSPASRSLPVRRLLVAAVVGLVLLLGAGLVWTRVQAFAAPEQPIAYSHEVHVAAGVECLYCHSGAQRTSSAGIPTAEKCMGCHAVIEVEHPEVQKIAEYASQGEAIPWVRVNLQPDFVFFSHQPHLGAGLNCEACHGEVSRMTVARPVVRMDMGWCLSCHLDQPQEKVARLADCVACHK